jgi:hypothetical protein
MAFCFIGNSLISRRPNHSETRRLIVEIFECKNLLGNVSIILSVKSFISLSRKGNVVGKVVHMN